MSDFQDIGDVGEYETPPPRIPEKVIEKIHDLVTDKLKDLVHLSTQYAYRFPEIINYLREVGLSEDIDNGIWDYLQPYLDKIVYAILQELIVDKMKYTNREVEDIERDIREHR